jgi:hypothetical protein
MAFGAWVVAGNWGPSLLAEGCHKPRGAIDHKAKKCESLPVRIKSSEAETAQPSASSSSALSFELEVNEIELCLDGSNRECLHFGVFVCSCIEILHTSHADNYPVQMQFSGL